MKVPGVNSRLEISHHNNKKPKEISAKIDIYRKIRKRKTNATIVIDLLYTLISSLNCDHARNELRQVPSRNPAEYTSARICFMKHRVPTTRFVDKFKNQLFREQGTRGSTMKMSRCEAWTRHVTQQVTPQLARSVYTLPSVALNDVCVNTSTRRCDHAAISTDTTIPQKHFYNYAFK